MSAVGLIIVDAGGVVTLSGSRNAWPDYGRGALGWSSFRMRSSVRGPDESVI